MATHRFHAQARRVHQVSDFAETDVDLAVPHQLVEIAPVPKLRPELHNWVGLRKLRQRAVAGHLGRIYTHRDRQASDIQALQKPYFPLEFGSLGDDGLCPPEQDLAKSGRGDFSGLPIEQQNTKRLLEILDAARERGLREVLLCSRTPETPMAPDREGVAHLPKLEVHAQRVSNNS